jgi:hypothetical protein
MQVEEREARVKSGSAYFSQHFGASSTRRSMVISPSDVSSSTDIVGGVARKIDVCRKCSRARIGELPG